MKERPILMSGPLVREILAGRKDVTRRPVKLDRAPRCSRDCAGIEPERAFVNRGLGAPGEEYLSVPCHDGAAQRMWCPYGAPGDRLWVRETWQQVSPTPMRDWPGIGGRNCGPSRWNPACRIVWRADGEMPAKERWRPGIHMPRWACRLVLDVLGVRVERLHEITDEDVRREGVADHAAFIAKWQEIYGAESWDANPWVWIIEFRSMPQESA
jgi:hypothetical protein